MLQIFTKFLFQVLKQNSDIFWLFIIKILVVNVDNEIKVILDDKPIMLLAMRLRPSNREGSEGMLENQMKMSFFYVNAEAKLKFGFYWQT